MDSKYCSGCYQKRSLSSFAKNGSTSRILASCAPCRASQAKSNTKRKALQQLDPNVPPKKRATACTRPKPSIPPPAPLESRPETTIPLPNPLESCPRATIPPNLPESRPGATIPPPNPPESRLETPIPIPTPPPIQPQALGFLPADQWASIQSFNRAMEQVKMESCSRCKERWFCMDLKSDVCHRCFNRDKGNKTPFLMSAENEMDLGEIPAYLPELTQVEEMIIARSHVQMMVHRYRGHQYHYSGHCVSFMLLRSAYLKRRVQHAKALTGWETRWERCVLPLLPGPVIYSSAGPWGFGGWPPIGKKSMSFPPTFLAGLDSQRAKERPCSQRHVRSLHLMYYLNLRT
jgi:hypothetical protein